MNLDVEETRNAAKKKPAPEKKLSRKEKKALKKAEQEKHTEKTADKPPPNLARKPRDAQATSAPDTEIPPPKASAPSQPASESEEVEARLDPSPIPVIPPPRYTFWEKISPPARRKKQITTMESGYREVLGLVHAMRNNQEVLMDAFKKLPEAVDSVKRLADHSAQQSDLLKAMNEQMSSGAAGEFNKTLTSMDQTTQLLLERAQRSEERLYGILRQAQRRIAFMTLLVLLLFLGAVLFVAFPEKIQGWFGPVAESKPAETNVQSPPPASAPAPDIVPDIAPEEETIDPVLPLDIETRTDSNPIDPSPSDGPVIETPDDAGVNRINEPEPRPEAENIEIPAADLPVVPPPVELIEEENPELETVTTETPEIGGESPVIESGEPDPVEDPAEAEAPPAEGI